MRRLLLFAAVLGSVASSLAGAAAVEAAPPRLAGTVMEDGFTDTLVTGGISNPISASRLLPTAVAIEIVARLADALHYAHQNQVVHRDIKPANIMFDAPSGELKITDFGIARLTD